MTQLAIYSQTDGKRIFRRFHMDVRGLRVDCLGDQAIDCPDDRCIADHILQSLQIIIVDDIIDRELTIPRVQALNRSLDIGCPCHSKIDRTAESKGHRIGGKPNERIADRYKHPFIRHLTGPGHRYRTHIMQECCR